ncbi:MAG: hypothetical protein SGJ23_02280 [Alphaproteobacteria bacterium]|nr:hypothetical protein [Alphaproteobacteria bacterium]
MTMQEAMTIRRAAKSRAGGGNEGSGSMAAAFNVFPLILIPVLIYNMIAFGGMAMSGDASAVVQQLASIAFAVPMASNAVWNVAWGDILVLIALVLLFIELLKSTSTGTSAIFNHALSMLVFIVCLVEFLLNAAFATSVFFTIMIMSLLDVLAGVVVTIVSARRDVEFDHSRGA